MTHDSHGYTHSEPSQMHGHDHAKKKTKVECEKCGHFECRCQSACCGGACPNCTF